MPVLYLFKEEKIWMYAGRRDEFSKELFLDYLSGDNFKESSVILDEDMQGWIEQKLGMSGGSRWFKRHMDHFEVLAEEKSRDLFKQFGLYHWSSTTKLIISLFMLIGPICFILIASFATLIIAGYNKASIYFYRRKVDRLVAKETAIKQQLEQSTGKKTN